MKIDEVWNTAHGDTISKDDLIQVMFSHVAAGGKIFVGSDSNLSANICTYVSVICLYNETTCSGGKYFFNKEKIKMRWNSHPNIRIMQEAQNSIDIALELSELFPTQNIEVHLDINSQKGNLSYKLADQLSGYAKSAGFAYKLKPHSWAASGIADVHTR